MYCLPLPSPSALCYTAHSCLITALDCYSTFCQRPIMHIMWHHPSPSIHSAPGRNITCSDTQPICPLHDYVLDPCSLCWGVWLAGTQVTIPTILSMYLQHSYLLLCSRTAAGFADSIPFSTLHLATYLQFPQQTWRQMDVPGPLASTVLVEITTLTILQTM